MDVDKVINIRKFPELKTKTGKINKITSAKPICFFISISDCFLINWK